MSKLHSSSLSILAMLVFSGCVGTLSQSGEGQAVQHETRIGGALRVGDEVGAELTFQDEDLHESINEFNGSLSLDLAVFRIGDQIGRIGYLGGEAGYGYLPNNGLSGWTRPWVARLVRDSYGTANLTLASGRVVQLFVPNAEDLEHGTTSDGGTWRALNGTHAYEVVSQGITYTLDVGDCTDMWWDSLWRGITDTESNPHLHHGHCEASRAVDAHGNGLSVAYYGLSDTRLQNDTFIPRVITRIRRGPSGETIDEGYAYFDLRDGPNVVGAPPDRTDLEFPDCYPRGLGYERCVPQWPTGHTPNDTLIRRIRFPGPESDPLVEDVTWQRTTFAWTLAETGETVGTRTPTGLTITTTNGAYVFHYLEEEAPGLYHYAYDLNANHIASVVTPAGQFIEWTWTPSHFAGEDTKMVTQRSLELTTVAPGSESHFTWNIHRFPVDRADGHNRQAAYTTYPTGMSTLSLFFPPAVSGARYPGFMSDTIYPTVLRNAGLMWSRAGLLTDRHVFDHDVWDASHDRLAVGVDSVASSAVQSESRGYVTHLVGQIREGTWEDPSPLRFPFAHGWTSATAFEVFTERDRSVTSNASAPDCCSAITYVGEGPTGEFETSLRCRVTNVPPESLCAAGDEPVERSCPSGHRCYRASSTDASRDSLCDSVRGSAPTRCPEGTRLIASGAVCSAQCLWDEEVAPHAVERSVVVQYRENGPQIERVSHAASHWTDFDLYGNRPFHRQFTTTLPVRIQRSPANCRQLGQPECGQDAIEATPTAASEATEARYRYVVDTTHAADYVAAGLASLAVEVRTCALGTSCDAGNGLLALAHRGYDNRAFDGVDASYPFTDAPGRSSSEALGDLTLEEDVDLDDASLSRRTYTRFYAHADAGERAGAVAERAVAADATHYRRGRMSYAASENTHGVISGPTSNYAVNSHGVSLTAETRYNAWGLAIEMTEQPYGLNRHVCFDARGRVVARFDGHDPFTSCADTSAASIEVTYPDDYTTNTTSRQRRGDQVFLSQTSVSTDSLGRPYTSEVTRRGSTGIQRVAKSMAYFAHTGLRTMDTEPYVVTSGAAFRLTQARTRREYDVFGRLTSVVRESASGAVLSETRQRYGATAADLLFGQIEHRDADGNVTLTELDGLGRPVAVRSADGTTRTTSYDPLSRPTQVTQGDGLSLVTRYIGLHEVHRTLPETGELTVRFDRTGEVIETVQANGNRVRYEDDELGRITLRHTGTTGAEEAIAYVYDTYPADTSITPAHQRGMHHLVRAIFDEGEVEFGYDEDGQVAEQVTRLHGLPEKRITIAHDASGSIARQAFQEGQSDALILEQVVDTTLSSNYEVQGLRADGAWMSRVTYDDLGRTAQRTFFSGTTAIQTQDFVYDGFSRMVGINDPSDLGGDAFAYRVRYEDPQLGAAQSHAGPSEVEWAHRGLGRSAYVLGYDERHQLTRADYRSNTAGAWNDPTTYDMSATYRPGGLGLLETITRTDHTGRIATTTLAYAPETRRLMSSTGAVEASFSYDAAGNLQTNSEWGPGAQLGYGSNARPRFIQDGQDRLEYGYDHQDNYVRIARQRWNPSCVTAGSSAGCYETLSTRHFVRGPGGDIVAEYLDASLVRQELPGVGYRLVDAATGARTTYFAMQDHIGSTRAVVNQSGEVVYRADFDPFGQELAGQGLRQATSPEASFATYRRLDLFSAIDLTPARFYHPGLGQFLAPDPLATENLHTGAYVYAENNPFGLNDPSGLDPTHPNPPDAPGMTRFSDGTLMPIEQVIITAQSPSWLWQVRLAAEGQVTMGSVRYTGEIGWTSAEHYGFFHQGKGEVLLNPLDWGVEGQVAVRVTVGNLRAITGKGAYELSILRIPFPLPGPLAALQQAKVLGAELQLSVHRNDAHQIAVSVRIEVAAGYGGKVHGYEADGATVSGRLTAALSGVLGGDGPANAVSASILEMVNSSLSSFSPMAPLTMPGSTEVVH